MADEPKARQVLSQLEPRVPVGDRTARRVGRRGFERAAIVSCSSRIFERYDLADPWNPRQDGEGESVRLGPVALKLTHRRQPAPHARVREPAAEKKPRNPADRFRPRGVPDAASGASSPPGPSAPRSGDSGPAGKPRPGSSPKDDLEERRVPRPPPPPRFTPRHRRSGRFRLEPTATTSPRVEDAPPQVVEVAEPAEPEPPAEPLDRSPGPGGGELGLDDLFGGASTAMGRDRRLSGSRKSSSEAEDARGNGSAEGNGSGERIGGERGKGDGKGG